MKWLRSVLVMPGEQEGGGEKNERRVLTNPLPGVLEVGLMNVGLS